MRHWTGLGLMMGGVVLAVALLLDYMLPLPLAQAARHFITTPGPMAAFTIFLLLSVDLVLPIPSSLVMMLSGAVFGIFWGSRLTLLGSLAGNMAGFELARRYGARPVRRLLGDVERRNMQRFFRHYGAVAVMLSRPLPVMMETVSVLAGLSTMTRQTFLAASLAGTLPMACIYAYAGAFALQSGRITLFLAFGMGLPAMAWPAVQAVLRRSVPAVKKDNPMTRRQN